MMDLSSRGGSVIPNWGSPGIGSLHKQGDLKPKALALKPSTLLRFCSLLVSGSNSGCGFVLGNIAFIIVFLYSSAMGPDNVRGSKSVFFTFCISSSDRVILPGESDPGLSRRFRGGVGDGSRLRFSGGNSGDEVEAVGIDERSVEVVDMFECGVNDNGAD